MGTQPKSLCVFLVLLISLAFDARADRRNGSWYVDTYGSAKPSAITGKAFEIFDQIKRTTGQQADETHLLIVKSDDKPWAVALPDGNIVLSEGGLRVIYHDGVSTAGNAQLAFILGHELAHHLNKDFEHGEIRRHLSSDQSTSTTSLIERQSNHQRELLADQSGFEYAALAGYRTDRILSSSIEGISFIEYWVQQTRTSQGGSHPQADVRTSRLQSHLEDISEDIEYFKYGIRLAHFGRNEDAKDFLVKFQKTFASSEVLNNLGYVYLQLARKKLPRDVAYRYWIPTLLETHSGLRRTTRGNGGKIPAEALQNLEKAVAKLEVACRMDNTSVTSRINLTAALLYLEKFGTARDTIEEALVLAPEDPRLLALRALILNEQVPDIDMWAFAKAKLEPLANAKDAEPSTVFNYARLLQERGREGSALPYWQKLAGALNELPPAYQHEVCTAVKKPELCDNSSYHEPNAPPWALPVEFGTDVDSQDSRQQLASWQSSGDMPIGSGTARIYQAKNGDSVLALDNIAEMGVVKPVEFQTVEALLKNFGNPIVKYALTGGEIYAYGPEWSAFVVADQVEEIWLSGL